MNFNILMRESSFIKSLNFNENITIESIQQFKNLPILQKMIDYNLGINDLPIDEKFELVTELDYIEADNLLNLLLIIIHANKKNHIDKYNNISHSIIQKTFNLNNKTDYNNWKQIVKKLFSHFIISKRKICYNISL